MDVNEKRLMTKRAYARNLAMQNQTPEPPSEMAVIGESLTRQVPSSILGFPGDMLGLVRDTGNAAYQAATKGLDAPYEPLPPFPGGSEWFKNNVFGEVANRDTYTPGQKLRGDAMDFAVPALVSGIGMTSKAKNIQAGVDKAPSLFAPMFEQYMSRPKSQIAQDVASSIGAAGGKNLAEDQEMGPIGTLLTTMLGGMGTNFAASGVESGIRNFQASKPIELSNGVKATGRTIDDTRDVLNTIVTDKTSAVQNIDDSLRMSSEMNIADPTLGPASGDVGLSMLDVRQRVKNPRDFAVRDQQVRTDVANNMNKFSNPEADVTAPQVKSQSIIDAEMANQQSGVDNLYSQKNVAEQQLRDLQQEADGLTAPIVARRGMEGRASATLDEQLQSTLDAKTKMKNDAFEQSAQGALVDAKSLLNTVRDIDSTLPALSPPGDRLPSWISEKIARFIPQPGTLEGPNSTAGMIPAEDVLKLRRTLNTESSAARSRGDYGQADQIDKLRKAINQTIELDPKFKDANTTYKEEYAPFFAQGYGKQYRDTIQKGDGTGTADSENIAKFFLNKTSSAAEDLQRIIDVAPDKQAADGAVEMYFDSMLAQKSTLNPKVIRNFIADNADVLPSQLKVKYDGLVKSLMNNTSQQDATFQNISNLQKQTRDAEGVMRKTEGALRVGPFGKMSTQDADKYVDSIMSSNDRLQQIDTVVKGFQGDQKALDGFKEAFVRRLQRNVRGTATANTDISEVDVDGRPVLYAKLSKTLDDEREALSKVFTPDEMNDLTRMQKLMARQGNLSRRATTGSDTTEKLKMAEDKVVDLISQAINIKFGLVGGGMINRVTRGVTKGLFAGQRRMKAEDLLTAAALNPKVAKEILNATPLTVENGQLFNRINAAMAAQDATQNVREDNSEKLTP